MAAALLLTTNNGLQTAVADGDTRTLSFHHVHTKEDITVTFKRNGRYDEAALTKLNWFMRDWRKDEQTRMEPQLFDLMWEAYRSVNGKEPIHIICGYRSPETNSMLRARSSGVAQFSLHTQGDAIDFFIPGVSLEEIRNVGLRLQRGGVGFYPSSGSPFVHLDMGSIRHWPRMTHDALARVFPNGRTVHVPSDGVPLPGYELALADVERQGRTPSNVSLAAPRSNGVIENDREPAITSQNNVLASFFGFGAKKEAEKPATPAAAKPAQVAQAPIAVAVERVLPLPKARPQEAVLVAQAQNLPPMPTPRPSSALAAIENAPLEPLEPVVTASASAVLAYAPQAIEKPAEPVRLAKPLGTLAAKPIAAPAAPAFTFASARNYALNDPWLRALMLTGNVAVDMTVTRTSTFAPDAIGQFMTKPSSAIAMSFTADPHDGMRADSFGGQAVVFVATMRFVPVQRTAALQ
ncbi:MAG: DUF882 domain-containing protein [Pseudolabrys sp.]|nr:DUF882 domain-containing protein [Pseudolabrys sp.]